MTRNCLTQERPVQSADKRTDRAHADDKNDRVHAASQPFLLFRDRYCTDHMDDRSRPNLSIDRKVGLGTVT